MLKSTTLTLYIAGCRLHDGRMQPIVSAYTLRSTYNSIALTHRNIHIILRQMKLNEPFYVKSI